MERGEDDFDLSSDSDFYGDDLTQVELRQRVQDLDLEQYWQDYQAMATILPRRKESVDQGHAVALKDASGGNSSNSWQVAESVDHFLERLPPATTTSVPGGWIWVHNPLDGMTGGDATPGSDFLDRARQILEELQSYLKRPQSRTALTQRSFEDGRARRNARSDLLQLAWSLNVKSGKWMLFREPAHVNDTWAEVAHAVVKGELGPLAKVEPRILGQQDDKERIICIYTADFRDTDDVARVLQRMKELGLVHVPIYYKPDAFTYMDIYRGNEYGLSPSLHSSSSMPKPQA